MSAQEVADNRETTPRGMTVLLNALVALTLLEKKNDTFRCSKKVAAMLSKDSPTSIVPVVLHASSRFRRWSELTNIIRRGIDTESPAVTKSERDQEAFIGAMHAIGTRMADAVVAAIKPNAARRLLDIGGATGTYTQAFLEACPGMLATLFDLPEVIPLARLRLEATGLLDRITLVAGDFSKDELPLGHDLAILSAIIHQNSPEQNVALYRKIFSALEPGGRLIIRDHIMNPDHTTPASGAFFAVNMLVATAGGGTYTFDEIRDTLAATGFTAIRILQADERMNGLVEGFKPTKG
jgi:Methylase involved in ubiquinone/menaquinone biosynthesis